MLANCRKIQRNTQEINSKPLFDELQQVLLHVFKHEIQFVVFTYDFFEFHDVDMVQFSQRLKHRYKHPSKTVSNCTEVVTLAVSSKVLPMTQTDSTLYDKQP